MIHDVSVFQLEVWVTWCFPAKVNFTWPRLVEKPKRCESYRHHVDPPADCSWSVLARREGVHSCSLCLDTWVRWVGAPHRAGRPVGYPRHSAVAGSYNTPNIYNRGTMLKLYNRAVISRRNIGAGAWRKLNEIRKPDRKIETERQTKTERNTQKGRDRHRERVR